MPLLGPRYEDVTPELDWLELLQMMLPMAGAMRVPRAAAQVGDILVSTTRGKQLGTGPQTTRSLITSLFKTPRKFPEGPDPSKYSALDANTVGIDYSDLFGTPGGQRLIGQNPAYSSVPWVHRVYRGLGETPQLGENQGGQFLNDLMMIIDRLSRAGLVP